MDVAQPRPARIVERRRTDLVEQLLDHAADPHDLVRPAHHLADLQGGGLVVLVGHTVRRHGEPVGADDDDAWFALVRLSLGHASSLATAPPALCGWVLVPLSGGWR